MSWRIIALTLGLAAMLVAADQKLLKEAKAKLAAKQFDAAIEMLDRAFRAAPSDPLLRKALSEAHMAYGDHFMYNDQMPVFMRNPNASRHYRLAYGYDKTNREAKRRVEAIDAVYKQIEKARKKQ